MYGLHDFIKFYFYDLIQYLSLYEIEMRIKLELLENISCRKSTSLSLSVYDNDVTIWSLKYAVA